MIFIKTRQAMYIQHNLEVCSCSHCCCGKAISFTHSEHVFVALGIQHAMNMCHIVICGLPGSTILFHISTIKKKSLLNIKCAFGFSLQLWSETLLILRRNERDMIKMYTGLHRKYPLLISDFNEN